VTIDSNIEHVSFAIFVANASGRRGKPIERRHRLWAVTTADAGLEDTDVHGHGVLHLRWIGPGSKRLAALYRQGVKEYYLGNHPLWQVFRALYQMRYRPYGIGGLAILTGFVGSFLQGVPRAAPPEVVRFCRREQMARLSAVIKTRGRTKRTSQMGRIPRRAKQQHRQPGLRKGGPRRIARYQGEKQLRTTMKCPPEGMLQGESAR
jgi:hypothetical protein